MITMTCVDIWLNVETPKLKIPATFSPTMYDFHDSTDIFGANLVMHICSMLQLCLIAIWSQGLLSNSGRSYATFGTMIPVFRANSGCLLGTKWQK